MSPPEAWLGTASRATVRRGLWHGSRPNAAGSAQWPRHRLVPKHGPHRPRRAAPPWCWHSLGAGGVECLRTASVLSVATTGPRGIHQKGHRPSCAPTERRGNPRWPRAAQWSTSRLLRCRGATRLPSRNAGRSPHRRRAQAARGSGAGFATRSVASTVPTRRSPIGAPARRCAARRRSTRCGLVRTRRRPSRGSGG